MGYKPKFTKWTSKKKILDRKNLRNVMSILEQYGLSVELKGSILTRKDYNDIDLLVTKSKGSDLEGALVHLMKECKGIVTDCTNPGKQPEHYIGTEIMKRYEVLVEGTKFDLGVKEERPY